MTWESDAWNETECTITIVAGEASVTWEWPLGLFYDMGPEETITITYE